MALGHGRITYGDGAVSLSFGRGTPYALSRFTRGVAEREDTDVRRPRQDGAILGRFYKGKAQHDLTLTVDAGTDEARAIELLRDLETAWDARGYRTQPGFLAELWQGDDRYCLGQPRALDPNDDGLWNGTATAELAFVAESDRWYGATRSTTVGVTPPTSGGLEFPAEAPFTFDSGPSVQETALLVEGVMPAWPVFTIREAITNPSVWIEGIGNLQFNIDLKYDQNLVADTRPHRRGIYLNGVAVPGLLSPRGARLSDMSVMPGSHRVFIRGHSPGLAELTVSTTAVYPSF